MSLAANIKGTLASMAAAAMLALAPATARGQDQHFSMLDLDPMLFNPAYSGFFDGKGRYGAVYRNQWASVAAPFQTLTVSAEQSLFRSARNRNGMSLGLWVSADRAGSLSYGTTTANLVVSYYQALGDGDDLVSVAVEGGGGQVGYNPGGIVVGDPSEPFATTHALYPTLGAGAAWFREWDTRLYTKLGFSARNLNQPAIGLLEGSDERLARRWNVYARAEWRKWRQLGLLPVVGFQRQGGYSELVYGADVRWYLDEHPSTYLVLSAGVVARHADAASINLGVLWKRWTFAFSYDANFSRLSSASHTLGAFELGVVYLLDREEKKRRSLPCPII
ncbi:MAG: PorP/SprF family type IX secretion system membrane protein [Bacteroidales bacterium]|nr:PorP/SprF family type IX secretion system membrane protein [Bacteroidales bacterium]